MSISVKNISLSINGTPSEQFKIEIDGAKYRLDDFSLKQQLLAPAQLSFSLRKDPEEDISEIQFTACSSIIGKEVILSLQTDNMEEKIAGFSDKGQAADVEFEGFITSASAGRSDSEYVIHVDAMSKDAALLDHPDCRMYNEYKLADIIKEVTDRGKVSSKIDPKYEDQIFYTVQYNESSYQFLGRMACRYGEWMFSTGKQLHFGKLSDQETIQLKYPSQDLPEYSVCLQTFHQNFMFAGMGANNYNKGTSYEGTDQPATGNKLNDSVFNASKEIFPHRTRRLMEGAGLETDDKVEADPMAEPEFIQQAQAERQGTRANMLVYHGTSYCSKLKIGVKLTIMDNYISSSTEKSEVQQDEILITEVIHTFGVNAAYSNSFQGITAAIEYPPYLNPNIYPHCDHPVRAHVVETEDPKHWSRVKVRFIWQMPQYKEGDKNGCTPWIPMLQPYIGQDDNAFGVHLIPEKFSEVYVDFEEGNFERPYVVAAAFSQRTPVDKAWYPGDNNVKAIRTASGHTIEIHDTQANDNFGDSGFIKIYDTKRNHYEVLLSTDQKLISLRSAGDISLTAGGNITIKAGAGINASAGGEINANAGSNISQSAGGGISGSAGGDVSYNAGSSMNLEASADLTASAGGNLECAAGSKLSMSAGEDLVGAASNDLHLVADNDFFCYSTGEFNQTVGKNLIIDVSDSTNFTSKNNTEIKAMDMRIWADKGLLEYSTTHDINANQSISLTATATIDIKAMMVKEN